MDEEAFKFPIYFQTLFRLYQVFFISPFHYVEGKGLKSKVTKVLTTIQKTICVALHTVLTLYIVIHGTSIPFINLRKMPIRIFEIGNFLTLWFAATSVLYLLWFKQPALKQLVEDIPIDKSKRKWVNIVIVSCFLVNPICLELYWITFTCIKSSRSNLDEMLYPILMVMWIKPRLKGSQIVGVTLRRCERVLAFFIVGVSRYNVAFASVLIWMSILGGLAIYEINSKIIARARFVEDVNILTLKIVRETLPKIQNLMRPLNTVVILACYANFSAEIVRISEYDTLEWSLRLFQLACLIGALLINAGATAKGRELSKLVLLQDFKFEQVLFDNGSKISTNTTKYSPTEVNSTVNLSNTASVDLTGPLTYGCIGKAFWVAAQFAIILVQFLELQKGHQDNVDLDTF